jgi:voltage-gated potassium channel
MKNWLWLISPRTLRFSPKIYGEILRRLFAAIFLLFMLIVIGTVGYRLMMHWSIIDSLYMTVITIATVGFREIGPLTVKGQIFTMCLIIGGLAVGGYAIGNIAAFFTEGQLVNILKGGRMAWEITNLKNHTIVCGYGKIGKEVCAKLAAVQEPFIVVETNADKIDDAIGHDYLAVIGDAAEDEILLKVGVKNARALVSAITDDSANVYLVLTARSLNENIHIVARGTDEMSRKKLQRVGANKVVSPYEIGAHRMAAYVIKPEMVDILDAFAPGGAYNLLVERIVIAGGSRLNGKKLNESNIRLETDGAMVIGIGDPLEKMEINPSGETRLKSGQILLTIGTSVQLDALRKLAG